MSPFLVIRDSARFELPQQFYWALRSSVMW